MLLFCIRYVLLVSVMMVFSILPFVKTIYIIRSGLGSGEGHCLGLGGVCRRPTCKVIEELISFCQRKIRCCRKWWILIPVPTPVIYTDYREALKPRIK
uniref:Beta-defensin n=1 Tax=Marmota marmota marmota TaxID=9994 RepID=A0A8C6AAD1_MARMA